MNYPFQTGVPTEMNECFDMELVLAGGKPGHFTSTLQCHIQHHPKPVGLAIEVTFKVRGVFDTLHGGVTIVQKQISLL